MSPYSKTIVAALALLLAGVLAFFFFSRQPIHTHENELGRLITGFMTCLPETTSTADREEIRGILNRFYSKAMKGELHADDVIEIEGDLRSYVAAGEIPDSLIFGFMAKVGNATRRRD